MVQHGDREATTDKILQHGVTNEFLHVHPHLQQKEFSCGPVMVVQFSPTRQLKGTLLSQFKIAAFNK